MNGSVHYDLTRDVQILCTFGPRHQRPSGLGAGCASGSFPRPPIRITISGCGVHRSAFKHGYDEEAIDHTVVPVRIDPELRAAIEARAEADHTSTSEIIRQALRKFLDVA